MEDRALTASPRSRGPIATGVFCHPGRSSIFHLKLLDVWVPAFAGTTLSYAMRLLTSAALTRAR
jgi:hypothetical protein